MGIEKHTLNHRYVINLPDSLSGRDIESVQFGGVTPVIMHFDYMSEPEMIVELQQENGVIFFTDYSTRKFDLETWDKLGVKMEAGCLVFRSKAIITCLGLVPKDVGYHEIR